MPFVDRSAELAELERLWAAAGPQLYVLYGRRRTGKTALLRHFLQGRNGVLFQAAEVGNHQNLVALMEAAASALGRPELARLVPRDIESALDAIFATRNSGSQPLAVVLDEFPNMLASTPESASLVQRFFDSRKSDDQIRLFLCGSAVRIMEAEVLGHRSALFGRRTGQRKLAPLPFEAWRPLFPQMDLKDRLWLHAATGGIPAYLAPVANAATAREALTRLFFEPSALLAVEADFLLRTEFSVVHTYASIIRAVAAGATRLQEIAERIGADGKMASRYLSTLLELGYVQRHASLDDPAPEKTRKGRYTVSDALLRYHFRFVQPYKEVLERGDGVQLYDQVVTPAMPTFCGPVFEDVVRNRLSLRATELFGSPVLRSGRIYGESGEIDVAMELMDGSWVLAEVKATSHPVAMDVVRSLQEKSRRIPRLKGAKVHLGLASLSGFSASVAAAAKDESIVLLGAEEWDG